MLFRWLFRKQLAEIAARIDALHVKEVTCELSLAHVRALESHLTMLVPVADEFLGNIVTQLSGFNARYNDLARNTAADTAVLVAKADDAVNKITASFEGLIDARVKAEMGKWAFSGGAGGALAAHQYCTRCTAQVTRWSMIPDEGPVCAKCLGVSL